MKAIYLKGQTDPVVISANEDVLDEILNKPPFSYDRHAYIDEWDAVDMAEAKLMAVIDTLVRSPETFKDVAQFLVPDPNASHGYLAVPPDSMSGVYATILNAMKSNKASSLLRLTQDQNHELRDQIYARANQPLHQLLTRLEAFIGRISQVLPKEVQREFLDLSTAFAEFQAVSRRVTDNSKGGG